MYISHLLTDEEMRELIRQTKAGVESIDFSIAWNLDHFKETLRSYEKKMQYMGCENLTVHGPFLDLNPMAFDSMVQNATLHRFEQAYSAAYSLGAKKVIYHTCFVPSVYFLEGWALRMAEFFQRFLEKKDETIQILIENVLDPFPEPLCEVADLITHPAFGVCLDVGHANCYSEISVEQWVEVLKPHIRHLHLHDNLGDKDSHLALGCGKAPLKNILPYIKELGEENSTIECNTCAHVLKSINFLNC